MQWFDVDKAGLAKILARRGKEFIVYELIQNAWDQNVMRVDVILTKDDGIATLTVEDDDPDGFRNLAHAFTLFAPSDKTTNPNQRGRFNLGEKLVLAMCEEAQIVTTTGGLRFDADGRHRLRTRREKGSLFSCRIRMTNAEYQDCVAAVERLLPPPHIVTTFQGDELMVRLAVTEFTATLRTEIADAEGQLRPTARQTQVAIYEPLVDEVATLYEMGIPIVETGDRYHVDIGQKVPLNLDRDNVPPAYLRDVRTFVLNATHALITDTETANAGWVHQALADKKVATDAVTSMVKLRFGDKAVAYDPSDPEANKRVVAAGYVVVTGSQMSKPAWENVRRAGVLTAAGRVMPTPRPYSDDPNAPPVKVIDWAEMNDAEQRVIIAVRRLGTVLLGFEPAVRLVLAGKQFSACYGGRRLDFNRQSLGRRFFGDCLVEGRLTERAIDLTLHEFGHEFCGDHLDDRYADALTRLGAKLALAVADQRALLMV